MKRFFIIIIACVIACVACETGDGERERLFTLTTPTTIHVGYEGDVCTIGYMLNNVVEEASIEAYSDEAWITAFAYTETTINFHVTRNRDKQPRTAIIYIDYGSQSTSVEVIQEANDADIDVDFDAKDFGGEYYGLLGVNNYRYHVRVADVELDSRDDAPNATYYYFDIFSNRRGAAEPILPNGTYTVDQSSSTDVGTISAVYSLMRTNDESGVKLSELPMTMGYATVTDNRFEAMIYLADGSSHYILYNGELKLDNHVYTPEYGSNLTEDLIFAHDDSIMRLYYYADRYGMGCSYWSVDMMESVNPLEGNYFTINILTDEVSKEPTSILGTYTETSDLDLKANHFISGVVENDKHLFSFYELAVNDYLGTSSYAPIVAGTITIEADDINTYVTIDTVDDRGNKVQGTFNCSVIELYDYSTW